MWAKWAGQCGSVLRVGGLGDEGVGRHDALGRAGERCVLEHVFSSVFTVSVKAASDRTPV